jgi:TRAP-type C4-dicarboxylate transport system permease small subunit
MDRIADRLAVASALMGGAVLAGLILMTCLSILGRALVPLGLGPVPGDFELVEAGIAFAVFAFLPIAQVRSGHATVDIFTSRLGPAPNRVLLALWEALFAAVLAFLVLRLFEGARGKFENGETSMFLQFPVWWAYAACMVPASLGVVVGLWSALDRLRAALTGRDTRPVTAEGNH